MDGVHWKAGSVLMPAPMNRISGEITIPWTDVSRIGIEKVPMKISKLGGLLTIESARYPNLTGEFLGSQRALGDAIGRGLGREVLHSEECNTSVW